MKKIELTGVLRKYRRQPDELLTALLSTPRGELLSGFVDLFTSGQLRLSRNRKPLCTQFYLYNEANAWVADWFLENARAKRDEGRSHYGIRNLLEKLRHDVSRGIVKADDFRICNDLEPCYARVVMMGDPSLCGFFTVNPSEADALVVDGKAWTDFAKEHEAELWPQRTAKKKGSQSVRPTRILSDERSAR